MVGKPETMGLLAKNPNHTQNPSVVRFPLPSGFERIEHAAALRASLAFEIDSDGSAQPGERLSCRDQCR
jgi:hypothetical protein